VKTRVDILPEIDRAVFRTITDADWARELRFARERKNAASLRIAEILAQKTKTELGKKIP
jgi:hypothetical protein